MTDLDITPKQLEILHLLYRYRFLNRTHIQRFLNHKDPKRINAWLKDLTDKNITGRKYSRRIKENTKPAIYHLATKSRSILLDRPDIDARVLKRVYREKNRSERLVQHSLLLADIFFLLNDQAKKYRQKLHFYTPVDLIHHYYLPYKRPDAYIALETSGETKRYFLEIIDEGMPRFMIRKRISQYLEYFEEDTWEERTGHDNPAVLIVCPNETILHFLERHIRQVMEEEAEDELAFYLSLKDSFTPGLASSPIWRPVEEANY